MRRLCVAGLLALALSLPALPLSLSDYSSPTTSMDDARVSFAYRYYDDAATPAVDANSGHLAATYDGLWDSPNLGFSASASCDLALAGFVPTAWLGRAAGAARLYPWEDRLFFLFAGAESEAATGFPQCGLDVRAGLGLGRFTDVTPLAKALEIDDALVAGEAIPNGLPDDVILAAAQIIGRAGEYPSVADVVAAIEAVVEFGAGVRLDARALLEIEDIVRATGKERRCGWAVQAGVGYEFLDPYGGTQDAVYAGSVDAALAGGPDDQLLVHASYSGPLTRLDESTLVASASYVLDFTPGASLSAGYTLARVKPAESPAIATHQASLGLTFDVSFGSLGLQVAVARASGSPGWSIDVSMSAALRLL
jgi:hypothetical protein